MKTPEQDWLEYRDKCVPKNAGEVQIRETKQAFIAGMMSGHSITCNICEIENEDLAYFELETFNTLLNEEASKFLETKKD